MKEVRRVCNILESEDFYENYHFLGALGSGSSAKVDLYYKISDRNGGVQYKKYAIKSFDKDFIDSRLI